MTIESMIGALFAGAAPSAPRAAAAGGDGKIEYRVNPTQWAVFAAALAAPPRDASRLRVFMTSRGEDGAAEPLTSAADVRGFSCGVAVLDEALQREARKKSLPADDFARRTFVLRRERRVVAYYTQRLGVIRRCAAETEADAMTILQMQRLAVDRAMQGRGLGTAMLRAAVSRALTIGGRCGARALCVHALSPEVKRFYLERGLQPMPAIIDPLGVLLSFDNARKASADRDVAECPADHASALEEEADIWRSPDAVS